MSAAAVDEAFLTGSQTLPGVLAVPATGVGACGVASCGAGAVAVVCGACRAATVNTPARDSTRTAGRVKFFIEDWLLEATNQRRGSNAADKHRYTRIYLFSCFRVYPCSSAAWIF